jgi:membrane associated rhomboid family serine protease
MKQSAWGAIALSNIHVNLVDELQDNKLLSFQVLINKRNIKTTWGLALIIIANFLLEEYFGGSQNMAVLVQMGAIVNKKVMAGEYYRLFTSVFLHAGWLHVFFNTYALIALGGFFNRILGDARFLAVFLFSGLCGSIASVFFSAGISVGASGAIWGLFGASLALSIFKTSLLPELIRVNLRRITLINIAINLGISFLPMIDIWAHVGGLIGGFLLGLFIVFSSQSPKSYNFSNYIFRFFSIFLSLIYIIALAYGYSVYRPWQNQLEAPLVETALPVPFKIEIPSGLKETKISNDIGSHFIFGEIGVDNLVIELHFFKQALFGDKTNNWLKLQREELLREETLPSEVKKTIYLKETTDGDILYFQQGLKNSELLIHNYIITRHQYAIRISLVLSKSVSQNKADELADKIIASIKYRD